MDTGSTGPYSSTQWRCQCSAELGWPSHSMCSSPQWQVGQSWFREKLSPANREQRLSRWADFAKNCLPRIGSKVLPRFREKYRTPGRQKMGSNVRPQYIRPRYIGSTLYKDKTVSQSSYLYNKHLHTRKDGLYIKPGPWLPVLSGCCRWLLPRLWRDSCHPEGCSHGSGLWRPGTCPAGLSPMCTPSTCGQNAHRNFPLKNERKYWILVHFLIKWQIKWICETTFCLGLELNWIHDLGDSNPKLIGSINSLRPSDAYMRH